MFTHNSWVASSRRPIRLSRASSPTTTAVSNQGRRPRRAARSTPRYSRASLARAGPAADERSAGDLEDDEGSVIGGAHLPRMAGHHVEEDVTHHVEVDVTDHGRRPTPERGQLLGELRVAEHLTGCVLLLRQAV